ncbi:MAG TPA: transglutaminaseTgpA domain-containing protein, partial [Solirubrobacteraceae bacterium]|nr:transglutaminaseTgpA domain-containing protein [Solirubrobacteraceae bacterium]
APQVDSHRAWFNYRALASTLAPAHVATFDWSQTYGPLIWPHRGIDVFEVQQARAPEYWKTENLDEFDGRAWTESGAPPVRGPGVISSASLHRWTETIQVTLRGMRTSNVIAAGTVASPPKHIPQGTYQGLSAGTWLTNAPLRPGDSYRVTTYSPTPTPAQLRAAGTAYPLSVRPYLQLVLRTKYSGESFPQITYFPQFGSRLARRAAASDVVTRSPYAPAYTLARRLESGAATPYAFVESVSAYLQNGYSYSINPPGGLRDPLESFLFRTRVGYCQQFAGAMAMLLRMGGVPARVSVGFSPGTYSSATHAWVVSDRDAHAWVEVWFPSYGWVRFDPTPPATGTAGSTTATSSGFNNRAAAGQLATSHGRTGSTAAVHVRHGGSFPAWVVVAAVVALLAALLGLLWFRRRAVRSSEVLLPELERALRRAGRPVGGGVTLAALERDLAGSPGAAAYVRVIRVRRYGGVHMGPSAGERRAFRASLGSGRGVLGRLRAWWALPPRRVRSDADG